MLLPWFSMTHSIISFPLPFRTAITIASLCTSTPIYLLSRLIEVASLGEGHPCQRVSSPKVRCHSPPDLPTTHKDHCSRRSGAKPYTAAKKSSSSRRESQVLSGLCFKLRHER